MFVVWIPVASMLAVALGGGLVVLLNTTALVERSMLAWIALIVVSLLWFALMSAYGWVFSPPVNLVIEADRVRVLNGSGGEIAVLKRQSLLVRRGRTMTSGKWWTNHYAALVLTDGTKSVVIHASVPSETDRSFGEPVPDDVAYQTSRGALDEILAALRA